MISLIICARAKDIGQALKQNIQDTIGVEYELIIVDNHDNRYSIFSAYNEGVARSQFPFLCFMHDDIHYLTPNWGRNLAEHFNNPKVGAIGIAGAAYYAQLPGPWWSSGLIAKNLAIDRTAKVCEKKAPHYFAYDQVIEQSLPVVVLDGVWLVIRKELFNTISFDHHTYNGFHLYDVDICLQIHAAGYQMLSVYDLLVFHASSGTTNQNWIDNCIKLHKKWEKSLPASVIKLNYEQGVRAEYAACEEFYSILRKNGTSIPNSMKITLNYIIKHRIKRFNILYPLVLAKYTLRYLFKKLGLR